MIAERATKLREQLAVRQANLLSENQHVHMAKRLEDLQTLASALGGAADYLREAPSRRPLSEADLASVATAREVVSEFRDAFSVDPVSAIQEDAFGGLQRSVKSAERALSNAVQADWEEAAQGERWEELAPMLQALEKAAPEKSPFFYRVRKLVDLVQALSRMADRPNPSVATRKVFAEKREEFDRVWAEVAGEEGIPDGLINFLGAAHRLEGAPLEALDEPIRGWLEAHGLYDRLCVRIR